ncbi:hypothetical protein [Halobacillus seohaensis]|uniref:Uncharacterized protein n=1 Tax=Halobacillus seohaensis TaxID=447421 RepID=A0ABW2ENW4_9BACI
MTWTKEMDVRINPEAHRISAHMSYAQAATIVMALSTYSGKEDGESGERAMELAQAFCNPKIESEKGMK